MPARLEGLFEAQALVNEAIRAAGLAAKRELIHEFALAVMGLAARRAPIDVGDLRGSFVVEVNGDRWAHTESDPSGGVRVVMDRTDVPEDDQVVVYIGTSGIPYAARQHEELTYRHPKGGQAKYLESALNELLPTLHQRLEEAARKGAQNG